MITPITTNTFTQSFTNRTSLPQSAKSSNTPLKYFEKLEMKLEPVKKVESRDSFEFAFDDMF